jgi:hypothetical protein
MKLALSIAVLQSVLVVELFAELAPTGPMWRPFYSEKLQVEWKVATNSLPPTVAIFKVVPASFSPAVISNVVRMTSFTSSNRIQSFGPREEFPPGSVFFQSQDERSSLNIVPFYGGIRFDARNDPQTLHDREEIPDEARAYELGTNILRQLELPPGEVQIRKDQQPRAVFLGGTSSMTCVLFGRRLDNIPCELNPGALRVGFGSHERVTLLELSWPGVKAEKRYPVATGGQIMAWIREGRARVQSLDGPIEARVVGPPSIKRLAIKGIRLHYSSFILESEGGEEKPADRLYPYAVLDTEAEFGPGDIETFPLICPVVPEGLPPVSHESLGFSIYPSKHNQRSKLAPSEPTTQ